MLSAELVNEARLLEVLDKGKAAAVTAIVTTKDKHSGQVIFENQSTLVIRGSGGFGGKTKGADRGAASAANPVPKRAPDAVVEEKTFESQAALYRLSGDYNPLHVRVPLTRDSGAALSVLTVRASRLDPP